MESFVHLVIGEHDMYIYKNIEKIESAYYHSLLISTFVLQSL